MALLKSKVTISDVAKAAGVSNSAVSYALNGKPGVSEKTRDKVLKVADSMGWKPNSAAKALSDASSRAIGLALAYSPETISVDSYSMALFSGMCTELERNNYSLMLRIIPVGGDTMSIHRDWIADGSVDGVVITNVEIGDPRIELYKQHPEVPVVALADPSVTGGLPTLTSDDVAAARLVVDFLHELGHTHIARVAGPERYGHTFGRDRAFIEETSEMGMHYDCLHGDYSPEAGADCTARLMAFSEPPTAIVYDSDSMAIAGLQTAVAKGIAVPEQLSIVSWDDSFVCRAVTPGLTALKRNVPASGKQLVPMLLRQIAGEQVENELEDPYELIPRGSTAAACVPGGVR
ncbi:LacI family DNA-binding transcriptional regulator [Bifidobacterium eulemuris]|uniref:LacI family DNA-binding transcriptional regulator n=1 Tax=Bifidobacterium eulemuris TaxID=1765219 RepID=A0A261GAZ3_9BIFI|nr:LacI family DNA-binding transcriptional regulator [Bifidobacterium eulemuris]OZG68589.1 LacI family transcriptional regulator [Bifidobacterium eulemuris]QOL32715.1 LacI family DNA-binding transcriptional regulator [Bifidobacterium eulemuris]